MTNPAPVVLGNAVLSNGSLAVLAGNYTKVTVNGSSSYYGFDKLQVAILPNNTPYSLSQTTGLSFPSGEDPNNAANDSNGNIGGGSIAALPGGGMAVVTWGGTNTNYDLQILDNSGTVTTSPFVIAHQSTSADTSGDKNSNPYAAVAAWSGGFVVAYQQNNDTELTYQRYTLAGVASGSPVTVANVGVGSQIGSDEWNGTMAVDSNGNVIFGFWVGDVYTPASYKEYNSSNALVSTPDHLVDTHDNNIDIDGTLGSTQLGYVGRPNFAPLSGGGFITAGFDPQGSYNSNTGTWPSFNLLVQEVSTSGALSTAHTDTGVIVNGPNNDYLVSWITMLPNGVAEFQQLTYPSGTSAYTYNTGSDTLGTTSVGTLPFQSNGVSGTETNAVGVGANGSNQLVAEGLSSGPTVTTPVITGLTAGTDTGTSGDNRTTNTEPSISGTGDSGDTVTIYLDGSGTALGTTLADSGGAWTYSFASPLSTGSHSITATDTNGGTTSSPSGSYSFNIDPVPAVTSVGVPANGTYIATQDLDFTVNFNEAVTITGTPEIALTLDTGGTVQAQYLSGSGTSTITFRYAVVSGEQDSNGITVGALTLNGGSITDSHGNNATLTLNSVGSTTGVLVDSIAPTVTSVSVPSNGSYRAGQALSFTVNFSENVTVAGTPEIPITLDQGGTVNATYTGGSGGSALTFSYTVASGNNDSNGITVGSAITLNGGTIKDSATNPATLTLNSVGSTTNVLVDTTPPAVSSITRVGSTPNNAASDQFTVTFSENVSGVDASDFTVTATNTAADTGISVTPVTSSTYTVTVSGVTGDGTIRLDLNSTGTGISDTAGNPISGGFSSGDIYTVEHTPPTVVNEQASLVAGQSVSGTSGTAGTGALAGDSDPGNLALSVSAVSGGTVGTPFAGAYGHLTVSSDGSYTYVADLASNIAAASSGSKPVDTFNYSVSDAAGETASATLSFTIDRPPVSAGHGGGILEGASSGVVSAGDTDPDGDTVTVTSVTGGTVGTALAGTYGSVTITSDDTYNYTADNTAAIDAASAGSHPVDTFTYTVADGHGGSTLETLTFTLDRAPTQATHSGSVLEAASTGTVSAGDSDPDGDTVTVTAVTGGTVGTALAGTYGTLTISANDTYTYAADNTAAIDVATSGSHPVDTFTYTVSDGEGGSTLETLSLTIDRPPTVIGDMNAAVESGAAATGNVLANDSDLDGDSLTVSQVMGSAGLVGSSTAGSYGHLTMSADGSYSYTADNAVAIDGGTTGSHLTDTFSYTANDGHGGSTSASLVVTIDRAPTQVTHSGAILEGVSTGTVSAGDSDPDGDTLTVTAVTGGSVGMALAGTYGTLTISANDTYTYTADNTAAIDAATSGSHPTETFTYTVSDGHGATTLETLTFTIDRAPVALEHDSSLLEGGSTGLMSAGDSDIDGDTVTVTGVTGGTVGTALAGTYGTLTISANDTYTYTADNTAAIDAATSGSHPIDSFTYTVSDGHGGSTLETLTFAIDRVPMAVADTNNVLVHGPAVSGNVLSNDSDADGNALTVTGISDTAHGAGTVGSALAGQYGSLTVGSGGGYTYTLNTSISAPTGSHPTDVFTYTVSDGEGGTTAQTLTITLNRAPVAMADSNSAVAGGAPVTGNVLTNDADGDGDALTVTAISDAVNGGGTLGSALVGNYGALTISGSGAYTYTPYSSIVAPTGSHPTDVFTYTVSDGKGGTAIQALTVTLDRAPTQVMHNTSVLEAGGTGMLSAGDSDPDGDSVTVTAVTGGTVGTPLAGTYGTLTISANDTYSYTADNTAAIDAAAAGSQPLDTFTYTVSDGHGGSTLETLTVAIDRAPTQLTHSATVVESGTTGTMPAGDSDPDGDSVTVTALTGGAVGMALAGTYGTLAISANDTYSYAADNTAAIDSATSGSHPTDSFTYTVSDTQGQSTLETLIIAIDRPPTTVADGATVVESDSTSGNVLSNDSDVDGDALTVSEVASSAVNIGASIAGTYGHLTLNADGSYSYLADNLAAINSVTTVSNRYITDTFTYTASDGNGGTMTDNLVISIDRVLTIPPGGTLSNTVVANGRILEIASGGAATGTVVSSGSSDYVDSGGTTSGTTVSDGGFEAVLPGGTVSGSTLTSGGYEYVDSGGAASGTTVSSGAVQNDNGTTSGTQLAGFQIVGSGGNANATNISSGGYQYILPGGMASGTAVSSGGIQNVDGSATHNDIFGFEIVFSGATADFSMVEPTGYQYILPGGLADHTIVSSGGIQSDDGTANNTSLGGFQTVFSGASASNTIIESGGYQYILPGGVVSNTTLLGVQNDDGVANGNTISSGGYQIVFSGASASGTTIEAGGFDVVLSGGTTSNAAINGGYLELGGGSGPGSGGVVTFASGGILKLDDSVHFNGQIAGFAQPDQLDLADIAFGSGTTLGYSGNTSSGTLTVGDGTHTANILLLGQYVAGNFNLSNDGNGGTLVTDPPVTVAADQQGFLTVSRRA